MEMAMEANLFIGALSGLAGAFILTLLIYLLGGMGVKIDIPYLLGSRFVDPSNRGGVYGLGVVLHLVAGAGWGVLYVFLLTAMGVHPDWPAGLLWGFAHGIFVGVIMGTLSQNHPHIGEGRALSDPGMMGRRWGAGVPYALLLLHMTYGAVTLITYDYLFTP
ncbi:MAG: hypothetical protein U5K31_01040 [Balneolaceae bacterium]|nr:hypothetical protein [Balneolaceae bacterium]